MEKIRDENLSSCLVHLKERVTRVEESIKAMDKATVVALDNVDKNLESIYVTNRELDSRLAKMSGDRRADISLWLSVLSILFVVLSFILNFGKISQ